MRRFFQRAYHFLERIKNESRNFLKNVKHFGFRTAKAIFIDGLFPPGKSEKYIAEIERFIDEAMGDFVRSYKINDNWKNESEKYPKSRESSSMGMLVARRRKYARTGKDVFQTSERYITS